MITAPYNFVPLNKEVFYPSWAEDVSHDIPFEDGESGEIDITITAKSPIFIRNNSKSKDNLSNDFCHFINENGAKEYYIPGSSIKGMVRNISEIIGFSKLKLQDKTLSYRDLNNPSYKSKAMDTNKIYMGWLFKDNDENWNIENLGKVTNGQTRIKYGEMKNYISKDMVNKIKSIKEAYKKYELVGFDKLKIDKGTIVFTGSTGKNKTREFLFPNTNPIDIFTFDKKHDIVKTFQQAYYLDTPEESKDWKNLWSKRFKQGKKIPIFFQLDEKNELKHFGLSMLYKLPYEHSLKTILERYQKFENKKDLAETIFGFVDDKNALKGRIDFSHFKCSKKVDFKKEISLPLSSPRPTFYPNYIVQCSDETNKTNKFITYDRLDSILRGFKIYPPRKNIIEIAKNEKGENFCQKNSKICTKFRPLNTGTQFKGKMRFHNLKSQELGLLLSSLFFLNQNKNEKYFHKLGMAKAYGYGTVSIKINSIKTTNQKSIESYINNFIELLNKELKIDCLNHPRIKAFLKLSSYDFNESKLKTMKVKDFVNAKNPKNGWCLEEVVKDGYDKSKICKKVDNKKKISMSRNKKDKPKTSEDLNIFFKNR
jgi:CRISPR-associated protein (TIGR03986 family)